MFRDDQVALAEQNDQLRREVDRLRLENSAMRGALQAYRIDVAHAYARRSIYDATTGEITEGDRVALSRHELKRFPVWAAGLLHVVTCGIWSIFHFGRMHGRLPKIRPDDPNFLRATLLFFVPYVNVWWMFFSPLRFIDRINFQFMLRRREAPLTKAPVVIGAAMSFFLYFTLIFFPIGWIVAVCKAQKAVNDLVALGDVDPVASMGATGVRVDTAGLFEYAPMPVTATAEAQPAEAHAAAPDTATRTAVG